MTKEEIKSQINTLECQQLELLATMQGSDAHASKCAKEGLVYKDTYPDEYVAYIAANKQYNDNQTTISTLEKELKTTLKTK
jgi:hypothetical protein